MPYFVEKLQKYEFSLKNIWSIQIFVVILQQIYKISIEI